MIGLFRRSIAAIFGALALASCSESPSEDRVDADPIVYEITDAGGAAQGWLLGTIHALPDGTNWRTEAIDRAVSEADYLIVEIAALDDRDAIAETFSSLATTPGQPEITARVSSAIRPALNSVLAKAGYAPDDFSATETWAASLMLAQVAATGKPANGVDKAIIRDFGGREIVELEGALAQLSIFDQLPERDQRDLLEGVLEEIELAENNPDRLSDAWLAGDEARLEEATTTGIMADPELREALLVARNRAWTEALAARLEAPPRPLIAVGAGHLVGPESVNAMLEQRGYTVTRITR